MRIEPFDVIAGKVVWINDSGSFGLLTVTTANGTDKPDLEYCYFKLNEGRVPLTSLEVDGSPQDTKLHFSTEKCEPITVGTEIYFKSCDPVEGGLLRMIGEWCPSKDFHDKLSKLDEYRIVVPAPELEIKHRVVIRFTNILVVPSTLQARGDLKPSADWLWQRRRGRGKRKYGGIREEEIERGWRRARAPV